VSVRREKARVFSLAFIVGQDCSMGGAFPCFLSGGDVFFCFFLCVLLILP